MSSAVDRGREQYAARAWADCCRTLTRADAQEPLAPDDLVLLAITAFMAGQDDLSAASLVRAHEGFLGSGDWDRAALSAYWLAFSLGNTGDVTRASAWASRAQALVDEHRLRGAVPAYLRSLRAHGLLAEGHPDEALGLAAETARVGRDERDPDLEALSLVVCGHALVALRRPAEALQRLDEAILVVDRGELTPPVAGVVYCSVILACLLLSEIGRASVWTAALSSWCDAQSGLVPYRGQCLVHRAQFMTLRGLWPEAMTEARSACGRLAGPGLGAAYYQLGELHRLRGEFGAAEDAYRRANAAGRQPEPGLARLRLAQGRVDAAVTAVRRLHQEPGRADRPEILAAYVEVMLASGRVDAAEPAAEELAGAPGADAFPLLRARGDDATGAVLLARGRPAEALASLRRACRTWQELEVPYDAARTRVCMSRALDALGDAEAARLERDAARAVFERLGAVPDLAGLGAARPARGRAGSLTAREVEVVRLVARGLSNRAVAEELVLSERTVARHLANVYAKLGLTSRAGATAYAYDHGLV